MTTPHDHQGVVWGSFIILCFFLRRERKKKVSRFLLEATWLPVISVWLLLAPPVKKIIFLERKEKKNLFDVCERERKTPIFFYRRAQEPSSSRKNSQRNLCVGNTFPNTEIWKDPTRLAPRTHKNVKTETTTKKNK